MECCKISNICLAKRCVCFYFMCNEKEATDTSLDMWPNMSKPSYFQEQFMRVTKGLLQSQSVTLSAAARLTC